MRKNEHEIRGVVAFVVLYHKHFYCISVKYDVRMHVCVILFFYFPIPFVCPIVAASHGKREGAGKESAIV